MFVQSGDFVNSKGMSANRTMTFYGQEKVEYNAQLCLMNMAVHGLTGVIKSGDEANTFYNDAHHLEGKCEILSAVWIQSHDSSGNEPPFEYPLNPPIQLYGWQYQDFICLVLLLFFEIGGNVHKVVI